MPAIDWRSCTKCGKCAAAVGGKGIHLDAKPREIELHSGVIVLATGYDPYEPLYGEYGYGIFPEVITLQQLNRLLDPEGPTGGELPLNGGKPARIGFIHCVGARQIEGVNQPQPDGKVKDYCGRTCCTGALHAALEIKERHPEPISPASTRTSGPTAGATRTTTRRRRNRACCSCATTRCTRRASRRTARARSRVVVRAGGPADRSAGFRGPAGSAGARHWRGST